jgi:hypothetical protein
LRAAAGERVGVPFDCAEGFASRISRLRSGRQRNCEVNFRINFQISFQINFQISFQINFQISFQISFKGNGQECPFHMGACRFAQDDRVVGRRRHLWLSRGMHRSFSRAKDALLQDDNLDFSQGLIARAAVTT